MFAEELKIGRMWHNRIDKVVRCKVAEIRIAQGDVTMKLAAINESEAGTLVLECENQTGIEAEWHPFSGEAAYAFEWEGVQVEIQV
jgi:hypothetical protein